MGHLDLVLGDIQRGRDDADQHGIETLTDLGPRVQNTNHAAIVSGHLHIGDAGTGVAMAEGRGNAAATHRSGADIDGISVCPEAL
jgi:hypothetical protein